MSLMAEHLLSYMQDHLGIDTSDIERSTPLFSTQVIDSFSLVSLITFIEDSCGIQVDPQDVTLENLDTIERILDYIRRVQTGMEG